MPKLFQSKNFTYLKNAYLADNLHHSYIFYGEEGSGKFDLALYFAGFLQCEDNKEGVPCGKCKNCKVNKDGFITNAYILNKEKNESITIGDVREMQNNEELSVAGGGKKVFIINNAQNLTREASEALLKTLEEPSKKSLIILITEAKQHLPKTILSRCHMVFFPSLAKDIGELGEENLVSIIDQINTLTGRSVFDKMILAKELSDDKEAKKRVTEWILVLHDIFMTKNNELKNKENIHHILEDLEKKLDYDKILEVLEKANNLLNLLDTNVSKRVLFEDFALNI
jgi:DNA polymerase III delta prime subunit